MSSILVINAAGRETRVALVENGHIAEFYLERKKDKGIVGNIYKGRVVRVLPGMQAAFVDIGLEKAAFLYVGDVVYDPDFAKSQFELTEGEHDDEVPDVPEFEAAGGEEHHDELEVHELPAGELAPPVGEPVRRVTGEFPAVQLPQSAGAAGVASEASTAQSTAAAPSAPASTASSTSTAATSAPPPTAPSTAGAAATSASAPTAASTATSAAAPSAASAPAASSAFSTSAPSASATALASSAPSPVPAGTSGSQPSPGAAVAPNGSSAAAPSGERTPSTSMGATAEIVPPAAITDDMPLTGGLTPVSPPPPDLSVSPPPTIDAATATIASEMPSGPHAAPPQGAKPQGSDRGERRAPKDQGRRDKHDRQRGGRDRDEKRSAPREEKKEPRKLQRIEDLLKVGQEVVVQASKDPIGTKGARLTSHISIPGRHLVFMPTVDHIGISRRIGNEKERRRLRDIVERLRPPGTGFIVRTVAENVPQEKLESDIRFLIEVWNEVVRANEKRRGPGLLHPDLDLILRATRDLFAHDVEKLVVDERDEFERIQRFVEAQDPQLKNRVVLHDNEEPVFDAYGIEQELKRATQRKVWLKSGGYLIMDQAEALTAIDVNSGRYVGKKSLEETITKINMEAAKEIVYQLRLRNIGGIIICDFIDMEKQQNRDKVFKALQDALGRDKAKTNVLRISELGLVEMTRKRVRESIGRMLHEDCSYCEGRGYLKTVTTVSYEIFREIRRESASYKEPVMIINCHPDVARMLQGEERNELRHLMDRYNKSIQVKAQQNYHREQFDIYGRPANQADRDAAHAPAEAPPRFDRPREEGFRNRDDRGGREDRGERGRGRDDRGGRGGRDRDRGGRGGGGGQNRGGENRGGDNRGGENRGGENRGGENRGGDNRGGENRGGENRGGENRGGDNRGGENRGGENRGGENRGGENRGRGGSGAQEQRSSENRTTGAASDRADQRPAENRSGGTPTDPRGTENGSAGSSTT